MILQNVLFTPSENEITSKMYYRVSGGKGTVRVGTKAEFFGRRRMVFDTYMNALSVAKWYRYTGISAFTLRLRLRGKFLVKLMHVYKNKSGGLVYEDKNLQIFESDAVREFAIGCDFSCAEKRGLLSFSLENLGSEGVFYGGAFTGGEETQTRPVKIGIGICTYKREPYVRANVERLKREFLENPTSPLYDNLEVFISDNGETLTEKDVCGRGVHLFKNKNTGGSGGFTRTMFEVNNANERGGNFTHILLMDDDVKFECECIYRIYSLLSLLNEAHKNGFVGGAMFRIETPYIQHASGERWIKERMNGNIRSFNQERDMRFLENVLENEEFVPADYQAWWCCAVPLTICTKNSLSFPFFIKMDDIEYGVRNRAEIILLNGIGVWHESFESKYAASNEYYAKRNYLIAAAARGVRFNKKQLKSFLRLWICFYLANLKYNEAELVIKAVEDFLQGADFFWKTDPEEKNKEIMKYNVKMVSAKEFSVPFSRELFEKCAKTPPRDSRLRKAFAVMTLNGLLLPSRKTVAYSPWGSRFYSQTFRAKYYVAYEPLIGKGFVLKRSLRRFLRCVRMYLRTARKINKNCERVCGEWKRRYPELITEEFWKTKL